MSLHLVPPIKEPHADTGVDLVEIEIMRRALNYTFKTLGALCNCSPQHVHLVLRGQRHSPDVLERVARLLGLEGGSDD